MVQAVAFEFQDLELCCLVLVFRKRCRFNRNHADHSIPPHGFIFGYGIIDGLVRGRGHCPSSLQDGQRCPAAAVAEVEDCGATEKQGREMRDATAGFMREFCSKRVKSPSSSEPLYTDSIGRFQIRSLRLCRTAKRLEHAISYHVHS